MDWQTVPTFGTRPQSRTTVIRPSAYGLIQDGRGRLAIAQHGPYSFLPGGGIEAGETPEQTIVREAVEECGLGVQLGNWVTHAVEFVYSDCDDTHFEKQCTFIDAVCERFDGRPTEPNYELKWLTPEAAIRLLLHDSQRWAVERWLQCSPERGN